MMFDGQAPIEEDINEHATTSQEKGLVVTDYRVPTGLYQGMRRRLGYDGSVTRIALATAVGLVSVVESCAVKEVQFKIAGKPRWFATYNTIGKPDVSRQRLECPWLPVLSPAECLRRYIVNLELTETSGCKPPMFKMSPEEIAAAKVLWSIRLAKLVKASEVAHVAKQPSVVVERDDDYWHD